MSNLDVESLANELMAAQQAGEMVTAPPSSRTLDFTLDSAYAVESVLKRWRELGGHRAVGRKVGYANKAMWRALKLETLVWAHMYDDTVHYADKNSATLRLEHARSLKIEPEIVFGLKHPLSAGSIDAAAALEATDWLAIGFEIIDCPFPGWKFQPSDFVASFGLHAALVVGTRRQVDASVIPELLEKLPSFKVRMLKDGEFVEEGSGKNSLRSPAACLAELAGAVVRRLPDEPLVAGEMISSGTLTAGHALQQGDVWTAEIEGLPLENLSLRLT